MKFMFAKFKNEIIEFLNSKDIEDEDDESNYPAVSYISNYNRLDLCEIVYAETDSFNGIDGNLDVVKYLTRIGASCSAKAMDWAEMEGHLDVVEWLHLNISEGCTCDAMDNAARNGHIDVVRFLHSNRSEGCTAYAMNYAAESGHLDVVKWLTSNRSEGCTDDAMNWAAANGHLNILKYLI